MKKLFSLLLSISLVTGCSFGSQAEEQRHLSVTTSDDHTMVLDNTFIETSQTLTTMFDALGNGNEEAFPINFTKQTIELIQTLIACQTKENFKQTIQDFNLSLQELVHLVKAADFFYLKPYQDFITEEIVFDRCKTLQTILTEKLLHAPEVNIGLLHNSHYLEELGVHENIIDKEIIHNKGLEAIKPYLKIIIRHNGKVNSVQFSPDNQYVATASDDKTAHIINLSTQQLLGTIQHNDSVNSAHFSHDGTSIVTASKDRTATVVDIASGQKKYTIRHNGGVNTAQFSPDNKYIITASDDKTANIVNANTGQTLHTIYHNGPVHLAQFHPHNPLAITASKDNHARTFDITAGKVVHLIKHRNQICSAQFSPDGNYILTASHDTTAEIIDLAANLPVASPLFRYKPIQSAQFTPDSKNVIFILRSDERPDYVFMNVPKTEMKVKINALPESTSKDMKHHNYIYSAQYSHDGRYLTNTNFNKDTNKHRVTIVNALTGFCYYANEHTKYITSTQFSPDGKNVATASQDNSATIISLLSPAQQLALQENNLISPLIAYHITKAETQEEEDLWLEKYPFFASCYKKNSHPKIIESNNNAQSSSLLSSFLDYFWNHLSEKN